MHQSALIFLTESEMIGVVALVALGVLCFIALVLLVLYNKLVGARMRGRESFSGIATELQRRHDLVPNLVSIVKGYAAHEKALFERVSELRSQASELAERSTRRGVSAQDFQATQSALAGRERELGGLIGKLIVQVEAYPELKASEQFGDLMKQLRLTEDRIQAARRFYNAEVRELNIRCESFPSALVAKSFGFNQMDFFQIEDALARANPDVRL